MLVGENVRHVSVGPAAKRIGSRYFMSFISEDGSMFEQPQMLYQMEEQMFANSAQLPVTLVMSADLGGNFANVLPFCSQIRKRAYTGLKLEMLEYSLGHVPMDVPAFGDSLNFIFDTNKSPSGKIDVCPI